MDDEGHFQPRCEPPEGLVRPTRRRPRDAAGGAHADRPTRHEVRRGRWRQTTHGYHVPAGTDASVPEQRVLEQSMRLEGSGAVTGWAALRMYGVAYCDGSGPDRRRLPVGLVSPRQLRDTVDSVATRAAVPDAEVRIVQGVPCVTVERAVVDELVRLDDLREGVVLVDMVMAARCTSPRRLRTWAGHLRGRRRQLLLAVLEHADERSRSPMETRMRLVWTLDAGLPRPLCNRIVYALDGTVLGCPDLLDPVSGLLGEYDGAAHKERERHRTDVGRADRFRRAGLECVEVVAGDSVAVQVDRMRAAYARAAARTGERGWTVEPPPGAWRPLEWNLDDELDAADWRRQIEEERQEQRRAGAEGSRE